MCMTTTGDQAYVLSLLLAGYTPEEAEEMLEERRYCESLTPLTDPTNVMMKEVADHGTAEGTG